MFSEKQASCSNKSCRQQLFSSYKPSPSRQYIAWSGPSTRLVSADNSISDGPQHICRRGRFIPDAIILWPTLEQMLSVSRTERHEKRAASFENRPDERRSGTTRNRTGDTRIFSPLLYQLSYGTIFLQYFLVFVSTLPELRCKGSAFILFLQTFLNIFPCVHIL